MSTQHRLNKNTKKIIKLDKVNEDVSSVAEYKRCAILKYCNENDIEKNQLDSLSISNELCKLGISYCFLTSIIYFVFEFYKNYCMIVIEKINVVIITDRHIHIVVLKINLIRVFYLD